MQPYGPYRTTLLNRDELARFSALRLGVAVRDTLFHWTVILACFVLVAAWPSVWVAGVAVIVIGANFYGLYIIGHDGLHRRLFEGVRANDLWNDVMIMGSFGAITRLNRTNHMDHHQDTCLSSDPDRHKYLHEGKEAVVPFLAFLSGLANLVPSVRNVFFVRGGKRSSRGYCVRDLVILLGWQILLFTALTLAIGWWAYPVLWLLPVYLFGYRADLTRVFCEHSAMGPDGEADQALRLITYRSNWLEKRFFVPHNMNFHAAHHLWPGIPYYHLPQADRLMRQRAGDEPRLEVRKSYVGYLIRYLRWRLANAQLGPVRGLT
jgi:fatty acid desaturase